MTSVGETIETFSKCANFSTNTVFQNEHNCFMDPQNHNKICVWTALNNLNLNQCNNWVFCSWQSEHNLCKLQKLFCMNCTEPFEILQVQKWILTCFWVHLKVFSHIDCDGAMSESHKRHWEHSWHLMFDLCWEKSKLCKHPPFCRLQSANAWPCKDWWHFVPVLQWENRQFSLHVNWVVMSKCPLLAPTLKTLTWHIGAVSLCLICGLPKCVNSWFFWQSFKSIPHNVMQVWVQHSKMSCPVMNSAQHMWMGTMGFMSQPHCVAISAQHCLMWCPQTTTFAWCLDSHNVLFCSDFDGLCICIHHPDCLMQ